MNEMLLLVEIIVFFGSLLIVGKFLKLSGIYAWITVATCLAEIQLTKSVGIFGLECSMGNVLFASTFLATDIIRENYGYEESKKGPLFSLLGALIYVFFAILTPLFIPTEWDTIHDGMNAMLSVSVRATSASVLCLFIANWLDVRLYNGLYNLTKGKFVFLRNNVSTIISNCSENFLLFLIGFWGLPGYDLKTCLIIALCCSFIESIIALLDTPFVYLSKKLYKK